MFLRLALTLSLTLAALPASAFCGFYVTTDDGALYNKGSKIVYTRVNETSVITLSSDYRGTAAEFALIVPTPGILARSQISTVKPATVAHLDAYTAPRLVEYFAMTPAKAAWPNRSWSPRSSPAASPPPPPAARAPARSASPLSANMPSAATISPCFRPSNQIAS